MIQQTRIGLASRELANPYNKDGFLPLITAPMSSVIDENNYVEFQNAGIHLCFARTVDMDKVGDYTWKNSFHAISLSDFVEEFVINTRPLTYIPSYRCIDTANGNIPQLHEAIRNAKKIHGDNLVIMAGNVSSTQAFKELAETGVDYIRVGIGGGSGYNTTNNTGVGQEDLRMLISYCKNDVDYAKYKIREMERGTYNFYKHDGFDLLMEEDKIAFENDIQTKAINVSKVKIVADGISTYIKQCESEYGFNDNGYAAINKLLFAGADLVMIGGLFAQCVESAGEKRIGNSYYSWKIDPNYKEDIVEGWVKSYYHKDNLKVKYSGMSTQEEQKKYKSLNCPICKGVKVTADSYPCYNCEADDFEKISGEISPNKKSYIKPSEGSVKWIPVRWTLKDWLLGSDNQDEYPYLMGWVNSIKTAMAYTSKTTL